MLHLVVWHHDRSLEQMCHNHERHIAELEADASAHPSLHGTSNAGDSYVSTLQKELQQARTSLQACALDMYDRSKRVSCKPLPMKGTLLVNVCSHFMSLFIDWLHSITYFVKLMSMCMMQEQHFEHQHAQSAMLERAASAEATQERLQVNAMSSVRDRQPCQK